MVKLSERVYQKEGFVVKNANGHGGTETENLNQTLFINALFAVKVLKFIYARQEKVARIK